MNSSAIPAVGDCGFFLSSSACVADVVSFWEVVVHAPNVCENLERSFKKLNICSESFNLLISGFTLSAKLGFWER